MPISSILGATLLALAILSLLQATAIQPGEPPGQQTPLECAELLVERCYGAGCVYHLDTRLFEVHGRVMVLHVRGDYSCLHGFEGVLEEWWARGGERARLGNETLSRLEETLGFQVVDVRRVYGLVVVNATPPPGAQYDPWRVGEKELMGALALLQGELPGVERVIVVVAPTSRELAEWDIGRMKAYLGDVTRVTVAWDYKLWMPAAFVPEEDYYTGLADGLNRWVSGRVAIVVVHGGEGPAAPAPSGLVVWLLLFGLGVLAVVGFLLFVDAFRRAPVPSRGGR